MRTNVAITNDTQNDGPTGPVMREAGRNPGTRKPAAGIGQRAKGINMAINYKDMTVADLITKARATLVMRDGQPMICTPGNIPVALINAIKARKDDIRTELIRRKNESDRQYEENKKRWDAERQAQIEADKPLLDQMHRDAESLIVKIPSDHVRVTVTQDGDADGVPILSYSVGDTKLTWADVDLVGTASAIRPGAMGSFAREHIASIAADKLAAIKAAQEADRIARTAAREARDKELAETPIPDYVMQDYNRYRGNADAAWAAEDSGAAILIQKWAPCIERQHGMHRAEFARQLRESTLDTSLGIDN